MSPLDEVADGVHRLGTDWVGWYVRDVDGVVTVVDCGFSGYFEQLPAALSHLGRSLDAVAAVVLTHYHPDHEPTGPRLLAFNEDAELARDSLSRLESLSASVVLVGHGRPFAGTAAEAVERARSSA